MSERARAARERTVDQRVQVARERREAAQREAAAAGWASPVHERLTVALDRLAASGGRPVCAGAEAAAWTSEDAEERAIAALFCGGCPVLLVCGAAGELERFGVWGGVDRGVARRQKRLLENRARRRKAAA